MADVEVMGPDHQDFEPEHRAIVGLPHSGKSMLRIRHGLGARPNKIEIVVFSGGGLGHTVPPEEYIKDVTDEFILVDMTKTAALEGAHMMTIGFNNLPNVALKGGTQE